MAKFTKEQIESFFKYEDEQARIDEMISEQTAEAWMNAKALGMDRPSKDALPDPANFELPVPDGYKVWTEWVDIEFEVRLDETFKEFKERLIAESIELDRDETEKFVATYRNEEALEALEEDRLIRFDEDWDPIPF